MMNGDSDFDKRIDDIRHQLEESSPNPIPDQASLNRVMPGIPVRRSALIHLTKLNGTSFIMNAELIETIESTPDTIISLVTGRKYLVREKVDEVRAKCIEYKKEISHK